jgi:3-deoxy-D-manno-octulosonic-acid transferase
LPENGRPCEPFQMLFRHRLAFTLYAWLGRGLLPLLLMRLWLRGRHEPSYRSHWRQRLGLYSKKSPLFSELRPRFWLHAVSLGETRAAAPLITALRQLIPHLQLVLTHGTATGREAGKALLQKGDVQYWLPLDLLGATQRFFRHVRPNVGVLMETEIWPALLNAASSLNLPVFLANARLSEKSLRKGQRLSWLLRPAMSQLAAALAQTHQDAVRLQQAGMTHVVVSGNLKFDMPVNSAQYEQGKQWRSQISRPIVIAASTRESEEEELLLQWQQHPWLQRNALLVIVPRHPQRFQTVANMIQEMKVSWVRRSQWEETLTPEAIHASIWLGDSLGEMAVYYSLGQVALLGGSFVPLGGQNLIEAAACDCPIVMGPHTFNFLEASELAEQMGAAFRVESIQNALELIASRSGLWRTENQIKACQNFAHHQQGAAHRMAEIIALSYSSEHLSKNNF